jgi:hypothetical protein
VERDRHHHSQHQPVEVLAAAGQELAQAAGHGGQDHVVDLGVVGVGDLLGHLEAAADDGQSPVGADWAVEAGTGGTLGEELPPGGGRGLPCPGGMGQARQAAMEPPQPSAQVVAQQLARRGDRGWRPRRRDRGGRIGGQVQQRPEGRHPGHAVGDGVMGAQEQAHLLLGQTGQQPGLPQRPGPIQASPVQRRTHLQ